MEKLRSNPWAVLAVLCMGFFMTLLDATILNIAIPSIIGTFNASLDQILWVLNGYILFYAVLLITSGRLGDIYGPRNLFVAGLVVFVLASAFSGLAQDVNRLIVGRVMQGIGASLLMPQSLAIITSIFPSNGRGTAFGIWSAVAGLASITGPTLGGVIIANLDWRWIFYVNLPIGALALTATFLIIPDLRPGRRHRLDLLGVVLISFGLLGVVFGLIEGERFGWGQVWGWITIPGVMAAGGLLLFVFVLWERSQGEPLLPFHIFRERNYTLMIWVAAAVHVGIAGLYMPMTIYLQSVLGLSALQAGLVILPSPVMNMLLAPVAGRLADRVGGKYLVASGLAINAVGLGLIVLWATPHSPGTTFLIPMLVVGIGQGFFFAPITTEAMRRIDPRMAGTASGILNTTRQVGLVVGGAVTGAILQNRLAISLHDQAVAYSVQLPLEIRQTMIDSFSSAVDIGLGAGARAGAPELPSGIPPQMAEQVQGLFQDVLAYGFVGALRPTLLVPIAVLLLGALSCVGAERHRQAPENPEPTKH